MDIPFDVLSSLCDEFKKYNYIDPSDFTRYHVKRGLRNEDGSGVMVGLTRVCSVRGYVIDDGERVAVPGLLSYRGINLNDILDGADADDRFGFEEVIWLLLFGSLPSKEKLEWFRSVLADARELPPYFAEDMIIKAPSRNIMNKLGRSVLALYSYDEDPDNTSLENVLRQCIELIARMPAIMSYAYQVKRRHFDGKSMFFHPLDANHSIAESILSSIRPDRAFTDLEAKTLDRCLMIHADHGGGNNSTFTARVLSSTGSDTYAAISAAIGSLKGPRHGGANIKALEMADDIAAHVKDPADEGALADYLTHILRKEAFDGSGLIYGMGHAVYTLSDPRAIRIKEMARTLCTEGKLAERLALLEAVEKVTPELIASRKGGEKPICANVDLYSGLVYEALNIPVDLFTPIFAVSRIAGWCAHRIEEITTGGRIIRPAYKAVWEKQPYVPLIER
ncbi:MAG: citrate synthase [Clostridia bacterium]|nr:citrate synthase [Clostridia bacterium]